MTPMEQSENLSERVQASDREKNLRKVLAVNAKINSTLDLNELLGIIMQTASEVMQAEAASLMLVDDATKELVFKVALGEKGKDLIEKFRLKIGEGIAGFVAEKGEPLMVNDTQADTRFARRVDNATGFSSKAIICVPMKSRGKIIGVLQALNPVGRQTFSQADLELFETFADQATLSVENARMHAAMVKQEKAKQELRIAHQIQQNFMPDLSRHSYPFDIAARNIPALDVGGDFYDVIRLDDTRTGIVIGDVSGKGVPAALYMVRAISEYRFLAIKCQSPSELLNRLNTSLAENPSMGMFVTFLYLILDHKKGLLHYSSAGHYPILSRNGVHSMPSYLADSGGMPLGLMQGVQYLETTIEVAPDTAFMLYTDGVIEARDNKGKEYGSERLRQFFETRRLSAADYAENLMEELRTFTVGAPQHDDTTILTLKIH